MADDVMLDEDGLVARFQEAVALATQLRNVSVDPVEANAELDILRHKQDPFGVVAVHARAALSGTSLCG